MKLLGGMWFYNDIFRAKNLTAGKEGSSVLNFIMVHSSNVYMIRKHSVIQISHCHPKFHTVKPKQYIIPYEGNIFRET